jgi:hypothetical protein
MEKARRKPEKAKLKMPDAFVDTTILVEATLKDRSRQRRARAGLAQFERSILPTYAIKEFRAGPLDTYIWFHNLIAQEKTLAAAILRAAKESAFRQYRLRTSQELVSRLLGERFPKGETQEQSANRMRRFLRRIVMEAWYSRSTVTTERTTALDCFPESDPREDSGLIVLNPTSCTAESGCRLAENLRSLRPDLELLLQIVPQAPGKPENVRRRKSLLHLIEGRPGFTDRLCRSLGDAVFALMAPAGMVIFTTNGADHKPLAEALGKRAVVLRLDT